MRKSRLTKTQFLNTYYFVYLRRKQVPLSAMDSLPSSSYKSCWIEIHATLRTENVTNSHAAFFRDKAIENESRVGQGDELTDTFT